MSRDQDWDDNVREIREGMSSIRKMLEQYMHRQEAKSHHRHRPKQDTRHPSPPKRSPSTRHSYSSHSSSYRDEEHYTRHSYSPRSSSYRNEEYSSRSRQAPRPSSRTRASSTKYSSHRLTPQTPHPPKAPTYPSPSSIQEEEVGVLTPHETVEQELEEPCQESMQEAPLKMEEEPLIMEESIIIEASLEMEEPSMINTSTPFTPPPSPIDEACQINVEDDTLAEPKEGGDQSQALVPFPTRSFKDVLCDFVLPQAAQGDASHMPTAQHSQLEEEKKQDMGRAAALETPKQPSAIYRCFKCHGLGHLQVDCPNKHSLTLGEIEHFYEIPIEKGMEAEDKEQTKDSTEKPIIIPWDIGEFPTLQRSLPHPEPQPPKEFFILTPSTPPPSKKHKGKGYKGKPPETFMHNEEDQHGPILNAAAPPSWTEKRKIDPGGATASKTLPKVKQVFPKDLRANPCVEGEI